MSGKGTSKAGGRVGAEAGSGGNTKGSAGAFMEFSMAQIQTGKEEAARFLGERTMWAKAQSWKCFIFYHERENS